MSDLKRSAESAGRQAEDSDWLDVAVRLGLVAYGVVHLLIAWLALQLALGQSSGSADSQGALQQLAGQSWGGVAIWLVAIGMALLVVWRLLEAYAGHRDKEGKELLAKRAVSIGKAVIYGSVAYSAFKIAVGAGSGKKGSGTDTTTAKLMNLPAGQWIVGAIGLAIIGYGVSLVVQAWTEKFRKHLDAEGTSGEAGQAYVAFGKAGYVAKGLAVGIVGGLFVYAAVTHRAKESGGLDQALHKVLQQPFGQVLLIVMAIGIACYGLFCFARARHLSR